LQLAFGPSGLRRKGFLLFEIGPASALEALKKDLVERARPRKAQRLKAAFRVGLFSPG
jgi:hypothetical protein